MPKQNLTRQLDPLRLYFLGLRHGRRPTFSRPRTRHIFKLEDERLGERAGLAQVSKLKRTFFRYKADIVFFRNRPELTTDRYYAELKRKADKLPAHVLQINPIDSFYNHSDKIRAFKLWEQAGIPYPEFIVLPEETDFEDRCEKVYRFIKRHDAILLRTNNEAVGNGLYSLDSTTTQADIIRILKTLQARVDRLKLTRKDSRIIAVKTYEKDAPLAEARVYVIGNQLLTEGSLANVIPSHLRRLKLSEFANSHDIDSLFERDAVGDMKILRDANDQLKQRLKKNHTLARQCVQAVHVLDNNIAGVDLIFSKGRAIFLEINPTFDLTGDTISPYRKHYQDMWGIKTAKELFKHIYSNIYDTYCQRNKAT